MTFKDELRRILEVYLGEDWEDILREETRPQKLTRTVAIIKKWIDKSQTLPKKTALEQYFLSLKRIIDPSRYSDFANETEKLYSLLITDLQEKKEKKPKSYRFQEYTGENAYLAKFNGWCDASPQNITIYMTWINDNIKNWKIGDSDRGNTKTRLLCISSTSDYIKDRITTKKMAELYMGFLNNLEDMMVNHQDGRKGDLEVRFYTSYPLFRAYIVDDNILFTVNWLNTIISERSHISLKNDNPFSQSIVKHVDEIWDSSQETPYSPELMNDYRSYIRELSKHLS